MYNGFSVGPFLAINDRNVSLVIILFTFAYWMTILVSFDSTIPVPITDNDQDTRPTTVLVTTSNHKDDAIDFSSNDNTKIGGGIQGGKLNEKDAAFVVSAGDNMQCNNI